MFSESPPELLYSASKKAGKYYTKPDIEQLRKSLEPAPIEFEEDFYEDPFDRAAREYAEKNAETKDFLDYMLELYDKVGGYYRWSYAEFMATPYNVTKRLNKKIDAKLENSDGVFSAGQFDILMAVNKVFGS